MKDKIALISRPKGYDYFNNSRSKQNDVLTHTKEECIAGGSTPRSMIRLITFCMVLVWWFWGPLAYGYFENRVPRTP